MSFIRTLLEIFKKLFEILKDFAIMQDFKRFCKVLSNQMIFDIINEFSNDMFRICVICCERFKGFFRFMKVF